MPRPAAEIITGDTVAVLAGVNQVMAVHGDDVTGQFLRGAEIALQTVQTHGIRMAILKDGSPSCGSTRIHDGTFTGRSITALLLEQHGVRVFAETEIEQAAQWLAKLENP